MDNQPTPPDLFAAIRHEGFSDESGIDRAETIHPPHGLVDLVHADLHLRPSGDSERTHCSGVIGTNHTTRPVSLSGNASLLSLHQADFTVMNDPDGRAWRLKVCGRCLAACFTAHCANEEGDQ